MLRPSRSWQGRSAGRCPAQSCSLPAVIPPGAWTANQTFRQTRDTQPGGLLRRGKGEHAHGTGRGSCASYCPSSIQRSYYPSKCQHFTHQGVCCSGRAPCRVPAPGRGCLWQDAVNTLCTAQNEKQSDLPRHNKPAPSTSHLPCVTASVYWPLWRRLWGSFQVTTLSQSDPAFPAMLAS